MLLRVQRLDGSVESVTVDAASEPGGTFKIRELGVWATAVEYERDRAGAIRWLVVKEKPAKDNSNLADLITTHGSARFRWIDVRPLDRQRETPVDGTDASIPLAALLHGEPVPISIERTLLVFGEDFEDTADAVAELKRRGYRAMALSGERFGGYRWLEHWDFA